MAGKNRDDFTDKIRTIVAQRAAYRCSCPTCRRDLLAGARTDPTAISSLGIAAHITAAAPGGPRYNDALTSEERGGADNAIWLCPTCSVAIDKNNGIDYPEIELRRWKALHEKWVQDLIEYPGLVPNTAQQPLNPVDRTTRYLDLKAAFNKGTWQQVLELAVGLEGLPEVEQWIAKAKVEYARLHILSDEIIKAAVDDNSIQLIRAARRMGVNLTPKLEAHILKAWEQLRPSYEILSNSIDRGKGGITGLAFAPNEKELLASTTEGTLFFFPIPRNGSMRVPDFGDKITILQATPKHHFLFYFKSYQPTDLELRESTPDTFKTIRSFQGDRSGPLCTVITPRGDRVIAGYKSGTILMWDYETAEPCCHFIGHAPASVTSLAITPDGDYLLSGGTDHNLKFWDLVDIPPYSEVNRQPPVVHNAITSVPFRAEVAAIAVTPDGRYMIVAIHGTGLQLWSLFSRKKIHDFAQHPTEIKTLTVTPDGYQLLAGQADGKITIWNIESGSLVSTLESPRDQGHRSLRDELAVTAMTVTADGRRMASGYVDGRVCLWQFPNELFSPEIE